MKTLINKMLKGRITRWGFLAGLLIAIGVTVGWMNQGQYKLGGGFIGSPVRSGGVHWSAFQAPLDPAGKTAALRVHLYSYGPNIPVVLALSEANTLTEGIGELIMISNDTAKGTLVFYGLKQVQDSPPEVKQIWVGDYTIKFTDPDTYDVDGTTYVYTADSDGDDDGRPDPGALPFLEIPSQLGVTRVLP